MKTNKLTQEWVQQLRTPSRLIKYCDTQCKGLYIFARPSGKHVYMVVFQCQRKNYHLRLGSCADMPLDEARKQARCERAKRDPRCTFDLPPPPMMFEVFGDIFFEQYARHWKPSTLKGNQVHYRLRLLPFWGHTLLQDLTTHKVKVWVDQQTHHGALSLLSSMMKKAEALGHIPIGTNPCKGLRQSRSRLGGYALTSQELVDVWTVLDQNIIPSASLTRLIRLLMLTGCRSSEIRTVKRCDYRHGALYLPDSKTGTKTVYLSTFSRYWLEQQLAEHPHDFIFSSPRAGSCISSSQLTKAWYQCRQAAGLLNVRLHDFRHTYASIALDNGEHLLNVGQLLGHECPETTLGYAHLRTDILYQASEQVSQSIARSMQL
jgi:integrase